mgnify:FL=1
MKGKKKNVIKVIIVLLLIGSIFYFVQPWIVYYTGPPRWTYERLCQSVQSGSYWNSARGRALDVDGHLDELKTETVFLNKKIQKLENGLYLLQCDGISEWQTWLVLFNRYPISNAKRDFLLDTMKLKGSDDNVNVEMKSSTYPIEKFFGAYLYVVLPSPMQIDDTITLEINGKEIDIEVETVPDVSENYLRKVE